MNWMTPGNLRTERKIPRDVYQAFYNLRDDVHFARIMEWLESARKEEDGTYPGLRDAWDATTCQGRTQALDTILGVRNSAQAMLEQLQKAAK